MNSRPVTKTGIAMLLSTLLTSGASPRSDACEGEIVTPDTPVREAAAAVPPDAERPRPAATAKANVSLVAARGSRRRGVPGLVAGRRSVTLTPFQPSRTTPLSIP